MIWYVACQHGSSRQAQLLPPGQAGRGHRRRAIGALVRAPGYLPGRLGLVLLGSHRLFALGVIVLAAGFALQAGTTSTVKAVKMSAKLIAGQPVPAASQRPAARRRPA
jgi:hypothetical protein